MIDDYVPVAAESYGAGRRRAIFSDFAYSHAEYEYAEHYIRRDEQRDRRRKEHRTGIRQKDHTRLYDYENTQVDEYGDTH